MHLRLTAVLLAGLVAFAGSGPRATPELRTAPSTPYSFPSYDRFDDLGPTAPPPSTAPARVERVTLSTRPIPRPATRSAHPVTESDLDRSGVLVAAYRSAAAAAPPSCNLPVALLAAIGQVESGSAGGREIGSDHRVRPGIYGPLLDGGPFAVIRDSDGGHYDGHSEWDRAVGPMQFIPSTWAWAGVDGDGDGRADPQNVYDAAHSAAGYLCRYGRDLSQADDLHAAIWSYNQSVDYVVAVVEWQAYFEAEGLEAVGAVGFRVASGGRASLLPALESTAGATSSPTTTPAAEPSTATTAVPQPVTTTPSATATSTTEAPTATPTGSTSATACATDDPADPTTTETDTDTETATETDNDNDNDNDKETSTETEAPQPTTTTTPTPRTTTSLTPTTTSTTSPDEPTESGCPTTKRPRTATKTVTVTVTTTVTTTTTATEGATTSTR